MTPNLNQTATARKLNPFAASKQHQFTHRPKNPFCKVCQKAKMLAPQARKKGGSTTIHSKKFGGHITIDHIITKDLRDHGFEGEKVAFVVKDVYSKFRYVYPSETKSSEQCTSDLQHFLKVEDKVGIVYSDNAPELEAAVKPVKQLGVRRNTSQAYVNEVGRGEDSLGRSFRGFVRRPSCSFRCQGDLLE